MTKYLKGDFVIIKDDSSNAIKYGQIEDIFEEDGEKLFRYNEYVTPNSVSIKDYYFAQNELLQTEEIEKEYVENIIEKSSIHEFDEYVSLKVNSPSIVNKNIFFYRQKYFASNDLLLPESNTLDTLNCCGKILNPDLNYIICNYCRSISHSKCLLPNNKCSQCKVNVENKSAPQNDDLLKKKRSLEPSSSNINNIAHNTSNVINLINNSNQIKINSDEYANLPEANRKYLHELKNRLSKISTSLIQKAMNHSDKTRKAAKDELLYIFLYGFEEAKAFSKKLNNRLNTEEEIIKFSQAISNKIENIIFIKSKQMTDQHYKNTIKPLIINLNRQNNDELRFKIINGEITPETLTKMTSEELAPSKLKQSRNELMNKYLKEQVIKKDEIRIIAKNHKGESMLTMDGEVTNEYPDDSIVRVEDENIYNKALVESDGEEENINESIEKRVSNSRFTSDQKLTSNNNLTQTIIINNNTNYDASAILTSSSKSKLTISDLNKFFDEQLSFLKPETRQLIEQKRKEMEQIM